MIGVPARVAQLLGDVRVPFQGERGRAKKLHECFLWCREWHDPQGERRAEIRAVAAALEEEERDDAVRRKRWMSATGRGG